MMDARRLAYLDAMEIDVWVPRPQGSLEPGTEDDGPRLVVSGGDGDILCVVGSEEEAGLRLATDIGRSMRCAPSWAWPVGAPGFGAEAVGLEDAVAERLLTCILVFGDGVASALFGSASPGSVGTARVHVVPSIERLGNDRDAKRELWGLMLERGIAAKQAAGKGKQ